MKLLEVRMYCADGRLYYRDGNGQLWRLPTEATLEIERAAPSDDVPEPPATPVGPFQEARQPFSMASLLQRAEDGGGPIELPRLPAVPEPVMPAPQPARLTMTDVERKERARALVRNAVNDAYRVESSKWLDWEQALLIKNHNIEAMQNFQLAAAHRGVTVQVLADQIIAEHKARGRSAGRVAAVLAKAETDIDNAAGDDIDLIASEAAEAIRRIVEINGDE